MLKYLSLFVGLAVLSGPRAVGQVGTPFCAATANSTGTPAVLSGSLSFSLDFKLHLEVSGGVPDEFGYFLIGSEATPGVVISEGLNCLVGTGTAQMFRYNVAGTAANSLGRFDQSGLFQNLAGTSLTGTGFDVPDYIPSSIPIGFAPGSTWHFQMWYRDSASMSGASNFSNGLSVMTAPPATQFPGMSRIPPGTFTMGTDAIIEDHIFTSNLPLHDVTISQPFFMGQHEVTQAEYSAIMGANPSIFVGPNNPVENVPWGAVRAYCAALNAQETAAGRVPEGYKYRLPTEAEWEYACRAGSQSNTHYGQIMGCPEANFEGRYGFGIHCSPQGTVLTTEAVGGYQSNAFGLFDMHGNVYEWCLDTLGPYQAGPVSDPFVTGGTGKIVRGGSYGTHMMICASGNRGAVHQTYTSSHVGFRVALAPILNP